MYFSNKNFMSIEKQDIYNQKLQKKGIRLFPYPFDSCISIISDIDFSTTIDHKYYTNLFIKEWGLDFSDSMFLYSSMKEITYKSRKIKKSMSLLEYNYKENKSLVFNDYLGNSKYVITELCNLNIDHIHSISDCGVCGLNLTNIEVNEKVNLPKDAKHNNFKKNYEKHCSDMPIYKILASNSNLNKIIVYLQGVKLIYSKSIQNHNLFELDLKEFNIPMLSEIDCIELISKKEPIKIVTDIFLLNFNTEKILNVIQQYSQQGLQFPLITDHASTLFLNSGSEKNNVNKVQKTREVLLKEWLHCKYNSDKFNFSFLGDEKESLFYIVEELKRYFNLRFVNPSGTSGEKQYDFLSILELLSPAKMRNNDSIYVARRLLIRSEEEKQKDTSYKINRRTKGFSNVLSEVLQRDAQNRVFPVYTHLGYIKPEERTKPYFDEKPFKILHARVYGKHKESKRTWFTRATILYDYSLIIMNIADHIIRIGDKIFLFSWYDKTLNLKLPISENQLHGLTFYVKQHKNVSVYLNFKRINNIILNGTDANGKKSVTLLGIGKAYDVNLSFSKIILKQNKEKFKYKLNSFVPMGTQYLKIHYTKSSDSLRFGFLIEIISGETFYFGDDIQRPEVVAEYIFKLHNPKSCVKIVPFYDLQWYVDTFALPSHEIKEITLLVDGMGGDTLEIKSCEFIRPSTIENNFKRNNNGNS